MGPSDAPATEADLESLLRERRYGPPDPDDAYPWGFTSHWSDVEQARVWTLVSRLLLDDDVLVRARCTDFARGYYYGRALVLPRLVEVAETRPDLYADQDEWGVTLRDSMAFALSNCFEPGDFALRVVKVLHDMMLAQAIGNGGTIVARYEPDFAIERILAFGEGKLTFVTDIARSIGHYRRDYVVTFLERLSGFGTEAREQILAAIEDSIHRDDELARHMVQRENLPPPTQPAPSPDDCRRAIALLSYKG